GTVTERPITILGPDLRESGDGKSLGLAKVVAGLTGLGADEIFRRAERERRRKGRRRNAVIAVLALLTVAATGSAVYAWQQLATNRAFLNETLKVATEIVDTAVSQAETYRVPRAATLMLLEKAEGLFDVMARRGEPTPELRYRKAWMLIQFARSYAILGDTGKQFARASEAYRLLVGLATENPRDTTYQRDLAVAYKEIGDVQVARGDLTGALKSYRDSLAIAGRLAQSDPGNAIWQRDLSVSFTKVGEVLQAQGDLAGALKSHRTSHAIAERLAQSDPGNAGWQYDLSVMFEKLGGVQVAQGDLAGALTSYRDSFAIRKRLAQLDPGNAGWQRALSASIKKLGGVAYNLVLAGDFKQGLSVADEAIALAPATIWIYANRAHALMLLGRVAEARALYLSFRGTTKVIDDKSWETIVLDDFAELRQAGITHSLMDEIETLFASRG